MAAESHFLPLRYAVALAIVMLVAGCGRSGHIYRIPSSAMEPTLHCGRPAVGCEGKEDDRVLVRPYEDAAPAPGDIVAFETPPEARIACGAGGLYVKRVIGLPGERWAERAGLIYIDGRRLAEPWVRTGRRDGRTYPGSRIPARRYLLLGDNRAASCDSRVWGFASLASIRGRVVEIKRGSERIHLR